MGLGAAIDSQERNSEQRNGGVDQVLTLPARREAGRYRVGMTGNQPGHDAALPRPALPPNGPLAC
jgi:hypothetical protein